MMAKWIKVSATVDEEFYHGTTTGENDSILKSVMSNGLDPSLAQGWGQGAGFYVFDNENKAKSHAMVVSDPEREISIAGNQSTPHSGVPMVLRLPVKYDSSIFDIDYETYPYFGAEILIALSDLIKTIPDKEISYNRYEYPEERIEVMPSKLEIMEFDGNRGIKIPQLNNGKTDSLRAFTKNNDGSAMKAEQIGKICEYLKAKFPSQFKVEEDKIFERIKNRKNQDSAVALKYNGKYKIHIDPSQDVQVYSNGTWISGKEYLNKKSSSQVSSSVSDIKEEKKLNSSPAKTIETKSATPPPSVAQLRNYIISQCKGDAYEIFLWSEGKSVVNNPPTEIRNIIMGMNPKITGSNYLINNIDAVNYFKSWIPMKTLGDEAFEYILDNNEEYLNLYKNFGRPTQKQNVQIIKKLETEGYASDNFEALDQAEKDLGILKSSKAIRKIKF